jgi:hypothetical protein
VSLDAWLRVADTNPRRHPMNQDTKGHPGQASKSGAPDNWDRNDMKPDFGDDAAASPSDVDREVPTWNEDQMARQRPDGSRTPGPTDEEIESSEGGLSGGGANPGGGERWAERDVEK